MTEQSSALINPALLKWARESGGYTLHDAAEHLNEDASLITDWEEGNNIPSYTQLKKIARAYRRPITAFYLPEPPSEEIRPFSDVQFIDYRNLPEIEKEKDSPAALYELRKAKVRRDTLLEIDLWRDVETPLFELQRRRNESADDLAKRVRAILKISPQQQYQWRDHITAYEIWRRAIESLGVLVFQTRYEKNFVVETREWRGVAIYYPTLPIIIVNHIDKPPAKIFTLFHELCHLIRGESSLVSDDPVSDQIEEIYCNQFAGSLLVPEEELHNDEIIEEHISDIDWSDEEIETLGKKYSVSRVVVIRRLLDLGYTSRDFYQGKISQYADEFIQELTDKNQENQFFKPSKPEKKAVNVLGEFFISSIIRAYHDEYFTLLDVAENLDTRFKKISDIERIFLQQPWPSS